MTPGFSDLTYYEVLDISPTVEPKEIQDGYHRVREAFKKGSLASYSLYTEEERQDILKLVEEAYHTLIDEQSREEYNKRLAQERARLGKAAAQESLPFAEAAASEEPQAGEQEPEVEEVTRSVMELMGPEEPVPPFPEEEVEDYEEAERKEREEEEVEFEDERSDLEVWEGAAGENSQDVPEPEEDQEEARAEAPEPSEPEDEEPGPEEEPLEKIVIRAAQEQEKQDQPETQASPPEEDKILLKDIVPAMAKTVAPGDAGPRPAPGRERESYEETVNDITPAPEEKPSALDYIETGVSGAFLKQAREAKGVTLEEVWETTRIRRPILAAIEEEEYKKLPADVFLKGMILTYARYLGVKNPEEVVKGYMDRLVAARDWLE